VSLSVFLGENTTDEMAFLAVNTYRDTPPDGSRDFLAYMEKLLEAEAIKKLLGGHAHP